jgi:hypothetical protein
MDIVFALNQPLDRLIALYLTVIYCQITDSHNQFDLKKVLWSVSNYNSKKFCKSTKGK